MNHFPRELRHDSGHMMTRDDTRLMLKFRQPLNAEEIPALLREAGLVLEDAYDKGQETRRFAPERVNHNSLRLWVRPASGQPIDAAFLEAIARHFHGRLDLIEPVYRLGNAAGRRALLCPFSTILVVRPVPSHSETGGGLDTLAERYGLVEVREKSKYLGSYRYFVVKDPRRRNAYELRAILLEKERELVQEALLENMPLLSPYATTPDDPLFPQQWNMTQIQADQGWNMSEGAAAVKICIFDSGCDLTHQDLTFASNGINVGTMGTGTFVTTGSIGAAGLAFHGTACAGVAAASINNTLGVAGLAGLCQIIPVAFQDGTDVELIAGINYAVSSGAKVLSMSFGDGYVYTGVNPWNTAAVDPVIDAAAAGGLVMCAATHNQNTLGAITYPATHPKVMACGASDTADNRHSVSNYGPQMSVVAPGDDLPTTDLANTYRTNFHYTSAATPHVSGLAALLFSLYPTLSNADVRNIIEQTADKVGAVAYTDNSAYPNGTWNQEMGYGRINANKALDLGDVMIRDYPSDTGAEPSNPPGGDFWDFSDIVVRVLDDNVFNPSDPTQSSRVDRKNDNFLYIRVTNRGPHTARGVTVDARITPYVGTQFFYPTDWATQDATHIRPTPITNTFATVSSGASVIAKFRISAAQVEDLWGWENNQPWHPCLLASVTSNNDYAFTSFDAFAAANPVGGSVVVRRNNLAQRNLTVVNLVAPFMRIIRFPFLAGHRRNRDRHMEILVDSSRLPRDVRVRLSLDEVGNAFPRVDLTPPVVPPGESEISVAFLERTRIMGKFGCCEGILILEAGSRFECPPRRVGGVEVEGGVVVLEDGRRFVEVQQDVAVVRLEKAPYQIYPLAIETAIPKDPKPGEQLMITVAQRDEQRQTVGGASVLYLVQ